MGTSAIIIMDESGGLTLPEDIRRESGLKLGAPLRISVSNGRVVIEALRATSDPVLRALMSAPLDDEPDEDNVDNGLTEARHEAREGKGLSHEEVKRKLGFG